MCGGIGFLYSDINREELSYYYTDEEIADFKKDGEVRSYFWQKHPVLPILYDGGLKLFDWGNRNKNVRLPKTGWARVESVIENKWKYLHPVEVTIPARRGFEKKVWFDIENGIKGLLVDRDGCEIVYMITEKANEEFMEHILHDRMPYLNKSGYNLDPQAIL